MKHLYLLLLFVCNIANAQFEIYHYGPPKFNFNGTEIQWHHRISDPYKVGVETLNHIKTEDRITIHLQPLIINDKVIAVYDNKLFGLIVQCYEAESGEIIWTRYFNVATNEDERGTSCMHIEADGDDYVKLMCFQSTTQGRWPSISFNGGFMNIRTLSVATGEQTDYLFVGDTDDWSNRIVSNHSKPMQSVRGQDLFFYYRNWTPRIGTSDTTLVLAPSYLSKTTLKSQSSSIKADTISFLHADKDLWPPNSGYNIYGPFIENDSSFVYTVQYYWESKWRHEMWKIDDAGHLKWRKDFTDLMDTPDDPKGLRYTETEEDNGIIRLMTVHSIVFQKLPTTGYVEMDFEGNMVRKKDGITIDKKKAGHLITTSLKGSDDLLHAIIFHDDNDVYFYKEKSDGSYLKVGELVSQNDPIFVYLPHKIIQDNNGDIYINFVTALDSIFKHLEPRFPFGGWLFMCKIDAEQLDIRVNTQDSPLATFTMYPNPTTGYITITSPENNGKKTVNITDLAGINVSRHRMDDTTTDIDISGLRPGLYFVTLSDTQGRTISSVQKLVKM